MLTRPPRITPAKRNTAESPPPASARGLTPYPEPRPTPSESAIDILTHTRHSLAARLPALSAFIAASSPLVPLSRHPAWLSIFDAALGHEPYALEASASGRTVGFLPLAFLESFLFGKFLVSLPYLNTGGVIAVNAAVQAALASRAVALADELNVRHLELRHESPIAHPELNASLASKVHMRLPLPQTEDELWRSFDPRVRNQIRKGEKHGFQVVWGGVERLEAFYDVLSRNMRDLGSPLYSAALFREVLTAFPRDAELCLALEGERPAAAALLLHGRGVTEVPTASALKEYNPTCVNMLMYWRLLQRAVARGQQLFDFGRSTPEGGTFKFKKQWGATPDPAVWQYRVNRGDAADMRPDNPRYRMAIRIWQRLPLTLTRAFGPHIVKGIP